MTAIQEQAQKVMDSLTKSVGEALERKRRLGQYAVIWEEGKVIRLYDEDAIPNVDTNEIESADDSKS